MLAILLATGAAAAQPAITSAYTKVDLDRCKVEEHVEEGAYYLWRCKGYRSVPLYVETGDDRFDVDAGDIEDRDSRFSPYFDSPPDIVEWRIAKGRPFAIIYRLTSASPDRPRTSTLVVETVGRGRTPGCRIAELPGATPNANEVARAMADRIIDQPPVCLKPE